MYWSACSTSAPERRRRQPANRRPASKRQRRASAVQFLPAQRKEKCRMPRILQQGKKEEDERENKSGGRRRRRRRKNKRSGSNVYTVERKRDDEREDVESTERRRCQSRLAVVQPSWPGVYDARPRVFMTGHLSTTRRSLFPSQQLPGLLYNICKSLDCYRCWWRWFPPPSYPPSSPPDGRL